MPSVGVKIYNVFFELFIHHRLRSRAAAAGDLDNAAFRVSCHPDEATAPPSLAFSASADGVASKDLHIDPNSSLSVRIFLPTPPSSPHAHLLSHAPATPPLPSSAPAPPLPPRRRQSQRPG
ncbi:unnamed protein product [Miscanthus lutarioriparius]|uniref:Uncharacterized protein n=1 Tax=Miscanthus lutarioriparius TaxID=422564 RepID=A0A811MC24_9POAL|nr:unnamed protein product [Miscanthus lutarioriparius]